MNCKKGDLAVVVSCGNLSSSNAIYIGQLVTLATLKRFNCGRCWVTIPALLDVRDGVEIAWHEAGLRPIRDQPGADETLAWAGKPASKDLVRA